MSSFVIEEALSGVTETFSFKRYCDGIEIEQSSSLDLSSFFVVLREAERHSIGAMPWVFFCFVGAGISRSHVRLVFDAST